MEFLETFFNTANIWVVVALFVVGLVLIIKGGDWFVDSASWMAEVLGVPKFIIGATIVSIATTLPEMLVSIIATIDGKVDMAAGNAVGSVTANTAMIMGIFIVCMPFAVKRKEFAPKALMMLGAGVALALGAGLTALETKTVNGVAGEWHTLSMVGTIVLFAIFIAFFIENFLSMKNSSTQIEPDPNGIGIQEEDGITPTKANTTGKDWAINLVMFVVGAVCIVVGAQVLINGGTRIARELNIGERVIGVIAVAIGTSLPELVTTITALRKKEGALSVGNVLGANIIDLTLILPICSFVSMGKTGNALVVSSGSVFDMIVCVAAICIAVVPTIFTKKFHRWQGVVSLAGYLGYVIYTFVAA